ncbi:TIGR03619 family F420-dependent LLM class oxidoreductase [Nocardia jinanensis]|uniref:LLM class F420-dependent oxidoreductase n=1 Tax=Nocardia jinanensis TaxID=382504 RepID=A0A917VT36_9NOCA|nr:TIGR03619 family F420-dependent LLM class oxidoreductase [Nocardia jinanensis]GGL15076.1 LLM class F420-dependent oxidoreductase [Nocardia jinanensis]
MKFAGPLPWMGPLATPALVARAATTVEALGYDGVAIGEHLFYPKQIRARYPYRSDGVVSVDRTADHLEIFTTLAYVAAHTRRLELLTHVVVLPYRSPVVTAKLAANVDFLSDGRLTLGVGVGWLRDEFEVLGVDWHRRGRNTDEALAVLRCLFEGEGPFEGSAISIPEVHFNPKPVQRPLPIWIGGMGPAAFRRVARFGQGWAPIASVQDVAAAGPALRAALEAAGRGAEQVDIYGRLFVERGAARDAVGAGIDYGGSARSANAEDLLETISEWAAAGATYLSVNTGQLHKTSIEEVLDDAAWFAEEVMPEARKITRPSG